MYWKFALSFYRKQSKCPSDVILKSLKTSYPVIRLKLSYLFWNLIRFLTLTSISGVFSAVEHKQFNLFTSYRSCVSSPVKSLFYMRSARSRKQPKPVKRLPTECLYPLSVHVQIIISQFGSFVAFSFSLLLSLLVGWQILLVVGERCLRWVLPEGGVKLKTTLNQQENLQEGPWQGRWQRPSSASCLPTPPPNNWAARRLLVPAPFLWFAIQNYRLGLSCFPEWPVLGKQKGCASSASAVFVEHLSAIPLRVWLHLSKQMHTM